MTVFEVKKLVAKLVKMLNADKKKEAELALMLLEETSLFQLKEYVPYIPYTPWQYPQFPYQYEITWDTSEITWDTGTKNNDYKSNFRVT